MESCQICFEPVAEPLPETDDAMTRDTKTSPSSQQPQQLVRALCGDACPATICLPCLAAHVRASLDDCYAGILPRVRCPICLTRLNKTQWAPHLRALGVGVGAKDNNNNNADGDTTNSDASAAAARRLAEQYATFSKKACSLQAPCCHKIDYSHLPDLLLSDGESAIDGAESPVREAEKMDPGVVAFLERCRAFCFHDGDGRGVVQLALETLEKLDADASANAKTIDAIMEEALARIIDDERRATLLLSYLYVRPGARTRCCNSAFCFNCKRNGHHAQCERESDVIDVDRCVARCRSCRVMIVKVEGCDSVSCVCGFTMAWERELAIQRLDRRGLVAVDIFDRDLYEKWEHWRSKTKTWTAHVQLQARERAKRRWIAKYAPLLRKCFGKSIWRLRALRNREKLERELFWRVYDRTHAESAPSAELDEFAAALRAINVCGQ